MFQRDIRLLDTVPQADRLRDARLVEDAVEPLTVPVESQGPAWLVARRDLYAASGVAVVVQ